MAPDIKMYCPFCDHEITLSFEDWKSVPSVRCNNCGSLVDLSLVDLSVGSDANREPGKGAL